MRPLVRKRSFDRPASLSEICLTEQSVSWNCGYFGRSGGVPLTGYVLGTLGSVLWCVCSTTSYDECLRRLVEEIGSDRNL